MIFALRNFINLKVFTARCIMCIAQYCYSKSSVRPSVRDVDVPWSYGLG